MSEQSTRRGNVLIIDDDELTGRVVARALSAYHDVVNVRSARDAIARLKAGERYDLVLCDLMMPDMTGMDLHDEVRSAGLEIADRIVFMTGGAVTERAQEFVARRPPDRVLEKPFDSQRLRTLVRDFVR